MPNATFLRNQRPTLGFWSTTGHPAVIDAAASVGPDFICIDTQHGVDLARVDASIFTVMANYGVAGLVRVESIEVGRIGRALDLGAAGIIVPLVESASDAAAAVAATRHAPKGGRSYGMQTSRIGPFDESPFVMIQVETAGAAEDIDAIASVDGVDGLYIGPADLGLALGGVPASDINEVFDGTHPNSDVLAGAFRSVVGAAKRNNIAAGVHCGNGATANRALGEGFDCAAVASDLGLLAGGLTSELLAGRASS